ncbi:abscisic acid receptor PYL3 isoform X2 [Zea mays]|uniref:abscisic acid receptor PYL3 isoform X2 n=1 Tax=Zea mays TaxID=4577 RepID=UPI0016522875|nr:uncharacterized protein LOC100274679 isoform X2 [Zea mays]
MVMVEMDGGVGGGGGGGQTPAPRRWRLADERCDLRAMETDYVRRFHRHEPREHQCSSAVAKHIKAPVHLVWSLVRRFDQPQLFKPFVSRCEMKGNIEIGSVREVNVKSGLPATRSTERLELLDDNEHILSVRFVGGDHRLQVVRIATTAQEKMKPWKETSRSSKTTTSSRRGLVATPSRLPVKAACIYVLFFAL